MKKNNQTIEERLNFQVGKIIGISEVYSSRLIPFSRFQKQIRKVAREIENDEIAEGIGEEVEEEFQNHDCHASAEDGCETCANYYGL